MINKINEVRRELANAIDPDKNKMKSYPTRDNIKWATPQSENRRALQRAHYDYFKEYKRTGTDSEVWTWYRKKAIKIMLDAGIKPSNICTEYKASYFYENMQ